MVNKKGMMAIYGLMMVIVIIILALAFVQPLNEVIKDARNQTIGNETTGMDCTNTSISDFNKAACLTTDISLPIFIGGLIGLGIIILGGVIITKII